MALSVPSRMVSALCCLVRASAAVRKPAGFVRGPGQACDNLPFQRNLGCVPLLSLLIVSESSLQRRSHTTDWLKTTQRCMAVGAFAYREPPLGPRSSLSISSGCRPSLRCSASSRAWAMAWRFWGSDEATGEAANARNRDCRSLEALKLSGSRWPRSEYTIRGSPSINSVVRGGYEDDCTRLSCAEGSGNQTHHVM